MVAAWDFNDEADVETDATQVLVPNFGSQTGTTSLEIVVGEAASQGLQISSEGDVANDTWNSPAEAGKSFNFLHGTRNNGTTATISFDASTFTQAVSLSFAINRVHQDGVSSYLASYSTDGGTSFTDVGSSVTIEQGVWNVEVVDFGTVLSGVSDARVRLTFDNGGAVWNAQHQTNLDNVALSTVPEPSTYAVIFGGLALAGVLLRRRR